jgi:hypothetical protein
VPTGSHPLNQVEHTVDHRLLDTVPDDEHEPDLVAHLGDAVGEGVTLVG